MDSQDLSRRKELQRIVGAVLIAVIGAGPCMSAEQTKQTLYALIFDPPLLVEHGLAPGGPAMGPPEFVVVANDDDGQITGTATYVYSDCDIHAGGRLSGLLNKGRLTLQVLDVSNTNQPHKPSNKPAITLAGEEGNLGVVSGKAEITQALPGQIGQGNLGTKKFMLIPCNSKTANDPQLNKYFSYELKQLTDEKAR